MTLLAATWPEADEADACARARVLHTYNRQLPATCTHKHLHCGNKRSNLVLVLVDVVLIGAHARATLLDCGGVGRDGLSVGLGGCKDAGRLGRVLGGLRGDGGDPLGVGGDERSVGFGGGLGEGGGG